MIKKTQYNMRGAFINV